MANEIGYANGGSGATTVSAFPGDSLAPVDTGLHTAGSGETITLIRFSLQSGGSATTCKVGLFAVTGGVPTSTPIYTVATVSISGAGTYTQAVSWALTNGVQYALAIGEFNAVVALRADTRTNGTSVDDTTGSLSSYTHRVYSGNIIELSGDITTSAAGRSPNLLLLGVG